MKKTYTLKRELTLLMIVTSVCTLLSVCAAVFYVFFSFFFQKTQEDIEYVLRYTSQQYEAHMQFIEDSVIENTKNYSRSSKAPVTSMPVCPMKMN